MFSLFTEIHVSNMGDNLRFYATILCILRYTWQYQYDFCSKQEDIKHRIMNFNEISLHIACTTINFDNKKKLLPQENVYFSYIVPTATEN